MQRNQCTSTLNGHFTHIPKEDMQILFCFICPQCYASTPVQWRWMEFHLWCPQRWNIIISKNQHQHLFLETVSSFHSGTHAVNSIGAISLVESSSYWNCLQQRLWIFQRVRNTVSGETHWLIDFTYLKTWANISRTICTSRYRESQTRFFFFFNLCVLIHTNLRLLVALHTFL